VTRSFTSFEQAADESGRSRIYGGIHYEFSNQNGQALGAAVGQAVLTRFSLVEDTQGPTVVAQDTAAVKNTNLTLTGQVLDNLSGVASVQYSVDNGTLQALALDATGHFTLTTALPLNGTADGAHTVTIVARDNAGNLGQAFARGFTLDTVAPT